MKDPRANAYPVFLTSSEKRAHLISWLRSRIGNCVGLAAEVVSTSERLSAFGLSSLDITKILSELEREIEQVIHPTIIWEYPTIDALVDRLTVAPSVDTRPDFQQPHLSGKHTDGGIAIIGLACRVPGASTPRSFWELLCDGRSAVTEISKDRLTTFLAHKDFTPEGPLNKGGFLTDIERFDSGFFGISPREALQMDPQQRLMLELSWESLEDAGIVPSSLRDSRTGVFFGAMWNDYQRVLWGSGHQIEPHTATGQDLSIISARVSYALGLRGPSVVVNTACSSSLVAVHLACQSLRAGESTLALAGGVNLMLASDNTLAMSRLGALSEDGRVKAFDASANGYVRGEGAVIVILKSLNVALREGDPIYCVILGSAVNNDGFSNGLTAPNPRAQEEVLIDAYRVSQVPPERVYFLETHGTGTRLGDPIEASALGRVLGQGRAEQEPLVIGSVKPNIGHLEAAAGIAGLMKSALCLHHRAIPPEINFETPNPRIDFKSLKLRVPTVFEQWPGPGPRWAGVSSFGFGGTNCHVVLESRPGRSHELFIFSADDRQGLRRKARRLLELIKQKAGDFELADICEMTAKYASARQHRKGFVVESLDQLVGQLEQFANEAVSYHSITPPARRKIVFVFSGNGSQRPGMGLELLETEPAFRAAVIECDRVYLGLSSRSLLAEFANEESESGFFNPERSQPLLLTLQVALAAMWRSWGIMPDAVVGHSVGEIAAAHAAGVISLQEAFAIVHYRSQLQKPLWGRGAMIQLATDLAETRKWLTNLKSDLDVAAINSPQSTVVSGDPEAIEKLVELLQNEKISYRRLNVEVAYHSSQMEGIQKLFVDALGNIRPARARVPIVSTVTGDFLPGHAFDAWHWARNIRQTVRFQSAIECLARIEHDCFLEVSAHPIHLESIREILSNIGSDAELMPSLRRDESERSTSLKSLLALFIQGRDPLPRRLFQGWAKTVIEDEELVQSFDSPSPANHQADAKAPIRIFPFSAKSEDSLKAVASKHSHFLAEESSLDLSDLCYTASLHREHHDHRIAITASSVGELSLSLQNFLGGVADKNVFLGKRHQSSKTGVVLVCAPQGPRWWPFDRAFVENERDFTNKLEECADVLSEYIDQPLIECIVNGTDLEQSCIAQPALVALQIALAHFWRSRGVVVRAVIGHSVGEVAAAQIAGAITIADAMRIAFHRGSLIQKLSGKGRMAYLGVPADSAHKLLESIGAGVKIAAVNSPEAVVISGPTEDVNTAVEVLQGQGVFCRVLESVDFASHSDAMESVAHKLRDSLRGLSPAAPTVDIYSPLSAELITGPAFDESYWASNLSNPVRFADAIGQMLKDGLNIFLEIGPHPVLSRSIVECAQFALKEAHVFSSLDCRQPASMATIAALAGLYTVGCAVDFRQLYRDGGRLVKLPTYPWSGDRFWPGSASNNEEEIPDPAGRRPGETEFFSVSMLSSSQPGTRISQVNLGAPRLRFLYDHRVMGRTVLPAALYIFGVVAAWIKEHPGTSCRIQRLKFERFLELEREQDTVLQLVLSRADGESDDFNFFSSRSARSAEAVWTNHALGRISTWQTPALSEQIVINPRDIQQRCPIEISGEEHRRIMREMKFDHGEHFRGPDRLWIGEGELIALIELPDSLSNFSLLKHASFCRVLDACFQAVLVAAGAGRTAVPVSIETLSLNCDVTSSGNRLWAHARAADADGAIVHGEVSLIDDLGRTLLVASSLSFRYTEAPSDKRTAPLFYEVELQAQPRNFSRQCARISEEAEPWLIFAGDHEISKAVAQRLIPSNRRTVIIRHGTTYCKDDQSNYTLNPTASGDFSRLLSDLSKSAWGEPSQVRPRIIHLWSLDIEIAGYRSGESESLEQVIALGCLSLVRLVQILSGANIRPASVWVIIESVELANRESGPLFQSVMKGLVRSLRNELPGWNLRLLELGEGIEAHPEAILEEIESGSAESEVILDGFQRRSPRLVEKQNIPIVGDPTTLALSRFRYDPNRPLGLYIRQPGILESLSIEEFERHKPRSHEVEIEVHSMGVNFLNVLSAMGRYPGYPGGVGPLGLECVGSIIRCGDQVANLRPGDEVIALTDESCRTFAIADHRLVAPRPQQVGYEEAVTLPIAMITALHALKYLAQLREGEAVLIHLATGGVGLAALQIARLIGAEIFASAGTPSKRQYLHEMGIRYVVDSRSPDFAKDLLRLTDGRRVDVVLNSLPGPAMLAGLSILKECGRFVELSKRDIYDAKLDLGAFKHNISYFAVDLNRMILDQPGMVSTLLHETLSMLASGTIQPIPHRTFHLEEAAKAFKIMAKGEHKGKLVISMKSNRARPPRPLAEPATRLRPDNAYIITGGTGALGLVTARWMVDHGARRIILISRNGPSIQANSVIEELKREGAEIATPCLDVSSFEDVVSLVKSLGTQLKGIVHAAGILSDATVPNLDHRRFYEVMAPKVLGAYNLHTATRDQNLDFFVLYSSALSWLGPPGQANYAAANAFLDALAQRRQQMGLPGVSINWGPWAEIGLAARTQRSPGLSLRGLGSLSPIEGAQALDYVFASPGQSLAVMRFNPVTWRLFHPFDTPVYEHLCQSTEPTQDLTLRGRLQKARNRDRRFRMIEDYVAEQVGLVLGIDSSKIERNAELKSLGLDSLMTVELRNRLSAGINLDLIVSVVWNYPTIVSLARHLYDLLFETRSSLPTPVESRREAPVETQTELLEGVSDTDIEARLAAEISQILGPVSSERE